jgi:hypothetical protein
VFKKREFTGKLHTKKFQVFKCEVGEHNLFSLGSPQKKTDSKLNVLDSSINEEQCVEHRIQNN